MYSPPKSISFISKVNLFSSRSQSLYNLKSAIFRAEVSHFSGQGQSLFGPRSVTLGAKVSHFQGGNHTNLLSISMIMGDKNGSYRLVRRLTIPQSLLLAGKTKSPVLPSWAYFWTPVEGWCGRKPGPGRYDFEWLFFQNPKIHCKDIWQKHTNFYHHSGQCLRRGIAVPYFAVGQ